ncbi:MAG: FadR/GntR family transcriptional regulator [Pseudomonadota bacterium]
MVASNQSLDSSNGSLRPIESGSAARLISELRNAIQAGMYRIHERLPAERALAEKYNTSRGTVREALKHLEEAGLVTRKVGSGTFVNVQGDSIESDIARATSPLELIDVRLGIETQIVRLAVINANSHDLDNLRRALQRVESTSSDPELFGDADSAFHMALADCTQNPLMRWLYRQLNDIRHHNQWSSVKTKVLNHDRILRYNLQHRTLVELIVARDMDGAVAAITEHLNKARSHLLGASAQ